MNQSEITEILNRPTSQELLARDLTRLAYVAKDGTPRNVPIAFTWNGSEIVLCTTTNATKLHALRNDPMVALTIDTEVHPPKLLLIRGRATLDGNVEHVLDLLERVHRKYNQAMTVEGVREAMRGQASKRVLVRIHPEHVSSWDHRKLGGVY